MINEHKFFDVSGISDELINIPAYDHKMENLPPKDKFIGHLTIE
jgi:hypothetical protein